MTEYKAEGRSATYIRLGSQKQLRAATPMTTLRLGTYSLRMALLRHVRDAGRWLTVLLLGLRWIVMRKDLPTALFFFGLAPGDDLLCTAVLRALRLRGRDNLLMISNHDELFIGNKDAAYVRPVGNGHDDDLSNLAKYRRFAKLLGCDFRTLVYPNGNAETGPPSRHIIAHMCADAGIRGPISLRPYLNLSSEEKNHTSWAEGCIAIQSSGLAARFPMRNKEWLPERFQEVVNDLSPDFELIQLGSPADPPLEGVKDLRGATTIRETASVLYNARLYVGTVGFLMHLARAVECPAVIIFGGREAPWQSGYICNSNIYSAVPCAPCWRWNCCDFDRKCMRDISSRDVAAAIREMLARPRAPLAVETVEIL